MGLQQEMGLRKGPEGRREWPWAVGPGFLGLRIGKITNPGKNKHMRTEVFILSCDQFQYCMELLLLLLLWLLFLTSVSWELKKKSAVLYRSIALIALHLLIGGAPSIFDWLQNLPWIRDKSLTSLSHWSPTNPPIGISFLSEDSGELLPKLKYPKYTLLLVWGSQKSKPGLEHFCSHFIMSLAWPWNSQTGGHLSTWGRPEGARPVPEPV